MSESVAVALRNVGKSALLGNSASTSPVVRSVSRTALLFLVLATVPLWMPSYWLFVSTSSFVFGLAALSVVVFARATGAGSLAQTTFMGISAYSCSWFLGHLGWPYLAAAIVAVILPVPIGMLLAFPALRLSGLELMVLTLTIALAGQALVFNTGAPFQVGDGSGVQLGTSSPLGLNLLSNRVLFWSSLVVTAIVALAVVAMLSGPIGSTWRAIRAGNAVAAASGIRITRHQLAAFGLSTLLAGIAGVMLLTTQNEVSTSSFSVGGSITLVVFAVLLGIDRLSTAFGVAMALGLLSQSFAAFNISGNWLGVVSGFLLVVFLVVRERRQLAQTQ